MYSPNSVLIRTLGGDFESTIDPPATLDAFTDVLGDLFARLPCEAEVVAVMAYFDLPDADGEGVVTDQQGDPSPQHAAARLWEGLENYRY